MRQAPSLGCVQEILNYAHHQASGVEIHPAEPVD